MSSITATCLKMFTDPPHCYVDVIVGMFAMAAYYQYWTSGSTD